MDQDTPVKATKTIEEQRDDAIRYARTCAVMLGALIKRTNARALVLPIAELKRFDRRFLLEINWQQGPRSYDVKVKFRRDGPLVLLPGEIE